MLGLWIVCSDLVKNNKSWSMAELYSVDREVWSKLAKGARIKCIVSKFQRDFDSDWQRVNAFSHCVTLKRVLLLQIISYSDTKVPVFVVMECKHASVIHVYELTFLLHTSRSTEYISFIYIILFFMDFHWFLPNYTYFVHATWHKSFKIWHNFFKYANLHMFKKSYGMRLWSGTSTLRSYWHFLHLIWLLKKDQFWQYLQLVFYNDSNFERKPDGTKQFPLKKQNRNKKETTPPTHKRAIKQKQTF